MDFIISCNHNSGSGTNAGIINSIALQLIRPLQYQYQLLDDKSLLELLIISFLGIQYAGFVIAY